LGSKTRQLRRGKRRSGKKGKTMKLIPFVPKILLTDTQRKPAMDAVLDDEGKPTRDENGRWATRRATLTQREFFLQRMEDQALVQGKEPRAAAKFCNKLYDAIEAQSDELVESRGGWVLEDEHAEAICRVVRKGPSPSQQNPTGSYPVSLLHNLEPHLDAVEAVVTLTQEQHKAILDGKPWKDPPASNGVGDQKAPAAAPQETAQA